MKNQHKQRYAPYSLSSRNPQRSNTLIDNVLLGFCKQLSKPLFSGTRADDDAFGAPWRTVDRETTELREELYRAQCEAAALEAKRKQEIEELEKKKQQEIQRQIELKEQKRKRKLEEEEKKKQMEKQRQLEEQERQKKLKEQRELEKIQRLKEQEEKRKLEEKRKQEELERQKKLEEQERQRKLDELERQRQLEEKKRLEELEKQRQLEEQERKEQEELEKEKEKLKQLEEQEKQQHQPPSEMVTPPRMESIFDTARKLAEHRLAFFTPDGTPMKPKTAVASSYKGKEVEVPAPLDFGIDEEDEEDDGDFDPQNASDYDDEEELLQGEMEPIDEYEEVTTPEMAHSPAATSQNVVSSVNEGAAISRSIEEPPKAADEVKVSVQFEDSDDDLVDDSVGVDSEEITQVITSMPSNIAEEEEEDDDDIFMTPRKNPAPSQGSWWPFSPRSLLKRMASEKKSAMSSSATQVDGEQVAALPDQPVAENEKDQDEDENEEVEFCEAIQSPSGLISPLRARHRINLHRALEEEPLSHPYVPASFADIFKSPEVSKRPRSLSEHDAAAKSPLSAKRPSVSRANEPDITAASLGLETRHSGAGKGSSRYKRQNTSVYYGSGYGSQSIPYEFNLSMAQSSRKPSAVDSMSNEGTKNSSITAQKILDIIGDVPPPPTYSQANLEIHDALNPHGLTNFFAASMRSSREPQRRRNLVPLSERLGQKKATSKSSQVDTTRSILDTIQAVAPPQVQARLGESKKPIEGSVQPSKPQVVKEVNRKRGSTSVSSVRSDSSNTSAHTSSTAFGASRVPVATSPSSLTARLAAKGQTTPKRLDRVIKQATTTSATAAPPTNSSRNISDSLELAREETAIATKDKDSSEPSPDFVFSLPLTPESPKSSEARKRAGELSLAELPVYAFALDSSAAKEVVDTQEKNIFAKVAASNKKTGEWTCSLCMLRNPSTAVKCTICETDKPAAATTAVSVSEVKANSSTSSENISSGSSSSNGFKIANPKDGEWICNVCNLINPKTATGKCTICDAAKPVEKPAAAATSIWELAAKNTSNSDQWDCGLCMLKNPLSATKCTVCEAPKPGSEGIGSATTTSELPETIISANSITPEDAIHVAQNRGTKEPKSTLSPTETVSPKDRAGSLKRSQLPLFDFDLDVSSKPTVPAGWMEEKEEEEPKDIFKVAPLKDGEWICDMCSLKNLPHSGDKCIACETPKK